MEGLTVTGLGSASAAPDIARVALGFEARADSVAAALQGASDGLSGARRTALAQGVAAADVVSRGMSVWSDSGYSEERARPVHYVANLGLELTFRDLGVVGQLLGDVVAAGGDASRLRGLSFAHADPSARLRTSRELAWADALATAEQLARLARVSLGRVLEIVESSGPEDGGPPVMAVGMTGFSGGEVPVEPGAGGVRVALRARWELG